MKSTGLFAELKNHPWILALVIILHLSLAVLLGMNLSNDNKPEMPAAEQHKIISAVVVDAKKIDIQKTIKKPEIKEVRLEEKKLEKEKLEKDRIKKEEEKKQIAIKEKLEKEKLEKKKLEKKKLEKKRQLELKKKKEQDRIKKEKLLAEKKVEERAKKEKVAKEKAEKEKIEKEKAIKKKVEAEKRRKLEEERKRRAEEKAEFKNALLEEEMAVAAAAREVRLQTQRQKYALLIAQKVESNWLRPVANTDGESCEVIVTQTMKGDVLDVLLQSCTSDNAFQRSVERAVRKASPLPMPPEPDVFERKIHFTFKPR